MHEKTKYPTRIEYVKSYFKNNVIFINVSLSPDLKGILETMWEKIVGKRKNEFQSVEDGHIQLQQHILMPSKPTLLILDDIWSRAISEKLLFEGTRYKTIITTRDNSAIPVTPFTQLYQLPLLGHVDALSLFCFWAFGQTSIPSTIDEDLVKKVQEKCGGLPLALKVIGSSLYGQPHVTWERLKNKISKGETILDDQKDGLLRCLEPSIDSLDDVVKECFLDLGLFPGNKKICVVVLLDIWVNVRKLEWQDAIIILSKIARRNLLNLTNSSRNKESLTYQDALRLYFSQHDVIRDLSLYLGCQDNLVHMKRLLMNCKENDFPKKWKSLSDIALDAQIVYIRTGFGNTLNFSNTNLRVFNLDHCSDLEIFPSSICHMPYAQIWSITNFHLVQNLPYNLGNIVNLRVLSLSALPILKELPASIGNLEQLEYLDISLCDGLRQLPEEIGQLKKLSELDMRECSHLTRLPKSIFGLSSLKPVICDEKIGKQYLQVKSISIPILEVEILETHFSLDWLDD
ncbi:hypothetical protein SUGI_0696270 [Cryptomeria japonica]|nr:hypothetical protein SUGI_0696270 [Cryptomeria japonica]